MKVTLDGQGANPVSINDAERGKNYVHAGYFCICVEVRKSGDVVDEFRKAMIDLTSGKEVVANPNMRGWYLHEGYEISRPRKDSVLELG